MHDIEDLAVRVAYEENPWPSYLAVLERETDERFVRFGDVFLQARTLYDQGVDQETALRRLLPVQEEETDGPDQ